MPSLAELVQARNKPKGRSLSDLLAGAGVATDGSAPDPFGFAEEMLSLADENETVQADAITANQANAIYDNNTLSLGGVDLISNASQDSPAFGELPRGAELNRLYESKRQQFDETLNADTEWDNPIKKAYRATLAGIVGRGSDWRSTLVGMTGNQEASDEIRLEGQAFREAALKDQGRVAQLASGVGESLLQAYTFKGGGLPAMVGAQYVDSFQNARVDALRSGKTEEVATKYADLYAIPEAVITAVAGKFTPTIFKELSKPTAWSGWRGFMGKVGKNFSAEALEELSISLYQADLTTIAGVSDKPADYRRVIQDTLLSVGLATGAVNGVQGVAEFIQNPSRSNARKIGLNPELADTSVKRNDLAQQARLSAYNLQVAELPRATINDVAGVYESDPESAHLADVTAEVFRGAEVVIPDFVYKAGDDRSVLVNLPNGKRIEVRTTPSVEATRGGKSITRQDAIYLLKLHGQEPTSANIRRVMKTGFGASWTIEGGQEQSLLGVIKLAKRFKGTHTTLLRHEALHMARQFGLVSDQEFELLVNKYSSPDRSPYRQEEDIATGMEKQRSHQEWLHLQGAIENTIAKFTEIGPLDMRPMLTEVAEQRFRSGEVFGREALPNPEAQVGRTNRHRISAFLERSNQPAVPSQDQRVSPVAPPVAPAIAPATPQQQAPPVLEQPAPQAAVPPQAAPVPAEAPPAEPPQPPTATPNDFPTESRQPNTYSPRHAWVREDVKEILGVDIVPQLSESFQQNKAEAIQQGIPAIALKLSEEIIANPRPLKDSEQTGIFMRYVDSMDQFKQLESQIKTADPQKQKHLIAARQQLHGELLSMAVALDYGGSEAGRSLNLRKMVMDNEGDLFTTLATAQSTKGTDLTRTEQAKVEAKVNKRDRLKKSVEKQEALAKKKQHREIARLKSAVSNIRQIVGLDPQKLGNVDVPGLTAEEQATVDGLRKKLDEAEKQLAAMENLPVLDRVNNRPSEKIISELDDAVAKVRSMIAAKKPKAPRPEPTSTEIENRRIKSLEKQLATIEEQIASPEKVQQFNFDVASKRRTELKAEISAARKRLREKQPPPSSLIEDRKIVALEKALAKTQQDLANAKKGLLPTGKPKPMDAASERRTFLNTQLKKARRELAETIQSLKPFEWWDIVTMSSDFLRNVKGGVDFSAIRRQGALVAGRPVVLARAAAAGVKAAKSDYGFERHYRSIMDRPNAVDYERTSLAVQDMDTPVGQKDEFMNSFLVSKIPFVKGSQRAYIAAINQMRADLYDILKEKMGGDAGLTWEQKKSLAHTTNVLTGRGDWKRLDQSMHSLSTFFWSPRLYLSRVQFLTGQPIWNAEPGTRAVIAQEMGRSIAGVLAVYSVYIAALAMREYARNDEVEWGVVTDPRHPAFGKIRIGDTYIDPTGGISQFVRFAAVMTSRQEVDDKGKVKELSGYQRREKITRMLQSKLAPLTGLSVDLVVGENYVGDPVNLTSFEGAVNLLTGVALPLSLNGPIKYAISEGFPEEWRGNLGEDIRIQLEQLGVPETIILNLLGPVGEGVTTYKKKKK